MRRFRKILSVCSVMIMTFMLNGCTGSNNWAVPLASGNAIPVVVITGPLGGSIFEDGDNITFTGSATDPEDGALTGASLVWTSDKDGQIGIGLTFDITTLSRNVHLITMTATDRSGATGTATIIVVVRAPWFDEDWGFRQMITIDTSMTPSDQTGFPVLIKISGQANPLFDNAQSDGDDIYFTEDDGVTQLDHEIEYYMNTATKELVAWVRIPILLSITDTVIFMYYGNAGVSSQENPGLVWDSNYVGVWHLAEDPSTSADGDCGGGTKEACDSTLNNNDGDSSAGMVSGNQVAGLIDGSLDFDAVDDYLVINDNPGLRLQTGGTFSMWMKFDPALVGARGDMLNKEVPGGIGHSISKRHDERIHLVIGPAAPWQSVFSTITLSPDTWYHVVGTFNNSSIDIYIDGINRGSGSGVLPANSSARNLFIGQKTNGFGKYDGLLDEVRISSIARSADWISTNFNNQNNPSGFLTIGGEEAM